jgi:glycosyltransferase involved in cell wall biosynthesis
MACGTPVIAFPCGSVPEVIDHGVTGFIVESVPEAIEAVKLAGQLSRAGVRHRFETRFSAARMAGDYLELYRRLIDDRLMPHANVVGLRNGGLALKSGTA